MELLYVWAFAPNSYLNIFDKVQEVEYRIADPTLCVSWTNSVLYFINILMFVSNKIQPPPTHPPPRSPENRKSLVCWCFQEVLNKSIGVNG